MIYINDEFVANHTDYSELVQALKIQFATDRTLVPSRHHYQFHSAHGETENTMLIMPAIDVGRDSGVKLVNAYPQNSKLDLPTIHGLYIYMDAKTGVIKATIDAKKMTSCRTAASSALASSYLSRSDSRTLLMIGTGALSIPLIRAHCAVRPIKRVFVWGRNFDKATSVVQQLNEPLKEIKAVRSIKEVIGQADIISSATMSKIPLILGQQLMPGQHIDLVGAYQNDMRESDDETIKRSSIYVDTFSGGLINNGDIVLPMKNGLIEASDIQGDLFSLCKTNNAARKNIEEITLFKSVGFALEDLVAARYYFNQWNHDKNI